MSLKNRVDKLEERSQPEEPLPLVLIEYSDGTYKSAGKPITMQEIEEKGLHVFLILKDNGRK
jgi:hypothetical protein